jgi:hypothetical protein
MISSGSYVSSKTTCSVPFDAFSTRRDAAGPWSAAATVVAPCCGCRARTIPGVSPVRASTGSGQRRDRADLEPARRVRPEDQLVPDEFDLGGAPSGPQSMCREHPVNSDAASGPALVFDPSAWRAFVDDVQVSGFDHG